MTPRPCTPAWAGAQGTPGSSACTRSGRWAGPRWTHSAKAAAISPAMASWRARCARICIRGPGCWSRVRAQARWSGSFPRCWNTTEGIPPMLLELARWLQGLEDFFGLFNYLTFRGILASLTALALSLWWGPAVIRRLAQYKGGQPIRDDGPKTHFSKAGTPTMGGALTLITVLASVLLWGDLRNKYVWVVLAVMVAFGAIGWYDDWIKIVHRDPNGLK